MNEVWSLEELYTGWEDERFLEDIQKLDQKIQEFNEFADKKLLSDNKTEQREIIREGLLKLEEIAQLQTNLGVYCVLRQSAALLHLLNADI